MKTEIQKHYSRIGQRGGRVSSSAKRDAARENALKRWGKSPIEGRFSIAELKDRKWYFGEGRTGTLGLWDAKARCFWTVAINEFADPAAFPKGGIRQARLKQEAHFSLPGGSFRPIALAETRR